MGRKLKYLFLAFIATACAKSTGFKASDYDYKRVERVSNGKPRPAPKPGSVVRDSNRIQFIPTQTEWGENNVTIKATVRIDEDNFGEVEFQGIRTDSRIQLNPVKPELNEKIRAQVICTSDEGTCNEFFIDVFYKENEVIFHDQTLGKPKKGVLPEPTPTKNDGKSKSEPKVSGLNGSEDDKKKDPANPVDPDSEDLIHDEIVDLEINEDAGFVGTSDDEAKELFQSQIPKLKSTPVTPEKNVPPKPETTQSGDEKKETPKPGDKKPTEPEGKDQPNQSGTNENGSPLEALEKFRATDQAIASPSKGRLERGTDLSEVAQFADFGFEVKKAVGVKDYYATFSLAETIARIAQDLREVLPNRTLQLTSLSKWGGGYLRPHSSHQNGTDADVRYLRNDEKQGSLVVTRQGRVSTNFLASHQWTLFKKAFETNNIEMIFVGPAIKRSMCEEARKANDYKSGDNDSPGAQILKRLVIAKGHNDHFHIRVKCSDRRCARISYNYEKVGC